MIALTTARIVLPALLSVILLCSAAAQSPQKPRKGNKAAPKAARVVSYKKDVLPIITTYCLPCHTEDQMNPSELYLDTYEGLTQGGKHGKPIVPSKPDSSFLIQKLSLKPPFGDPMPLKRKTPVPQDTIDIIKNWIGQGAKKN